MLSFIGPEGWGDDVSPEEMKEVMGRWWAYDQALRDAGAYIAGEALQESHTATTVRIGDGEERLVTDGPYAETKEQLGGFYVLECENLDEALEWAKKVPLGRGGTEVRPVMDFSQFDLDQAAASTEASS
ncbi:MAG: YciI family protein [Solirubrobacterales bacterium]|nr:YciI family protein [Solirubrobacterales bacterium]